MNELPQLIIDDFDEEVYEIDDNLELIIDQNGSYLNSNEGLFYLMSLDNLKKINGHYILVDKEFPEDKLIVDEFQYNLIKNVFEMKKGNIFIVDKNELQ